VSDGETLVLVEPSSTALGYLALGAALTAGSVLLIAIGDYGVGILGAAFFGLLAGIFVVQLVRPPTLVLGPEGFTASTGVRDGKLVKWADIARFEAVTLPQVSLGSLLFPRRRVGWILKTGGKTSFMLPVHGVLTQQYGHAPESLALILEAHRSRLA
jgi:hypothetical protein